MKCPNCGGTGKEYWNGNVFCNTGFECDKCNGTGNVEQTNKEWLQTTTTEQLADKLTDFSFWLVFTIPTKDMREKVRKRIVEWLKQPHTTIKE